MGKYPDPKLRIESNFHFPEVGQSQQGLARSTESIASIDSTLSSSPCAWGSQDRSANVSFAKVNFNICVSIKQVDLNFIGSLLQRFIMVVALGEVLEDAQ